MYKKDFRKIDTTWNLFIVRKNWNTGWANSGRKRNEKDERPPRGRRQKRKRKRKEQKKVTNVICCLSHWKVLPNLVIRACSDKYDEFLWRYVLWDWQGRKVITLGKRVKPFQMGGLKWVNQSLKMKWEKSKTLSVKHSTMPEGWGSQ